MTHALLHPRRTAASAVARIATHTALYIGEGNRVVFAELAASYADFIYAFGDGDLDDDRLADLLTLYSAGTTKPDEIHVDHATHKITSEQRGGQDWLMDMLRTLHQAALTDDANRKAELLLLASAYGGMHEQTRLQAYIAAALSTAIDDVLIPQPRLDATPDAHHHHGPVDWISTVEAVISDYGGHVAQVMGDGVLAYFGYPRAREDDARRACMSGLAIVQAVEQPEVSVSGLGPIELTARVGVHTGTALLDVVGIDHQEILAFGESMNLAARLQTVAEPGSVVISAATHMLVHELFEFADLGEEQLRGIGGATHVYRLRRTRRAVEIVTSASGTGLPLIGRGPELELILSRWHEASTGHGRIVMLTAEAGLGKSRMVREVRARVEGDAQWLHARGSSFTVDPPLHPVREMLTDLLSTSTHPTGDELRAALHDLQAGDDVSIALIAALLELPCPADVPAVPLSPQVLRQMTLDLVIELLIRASAKTPVVMGDRGRAMAGCIHPGPAGHPRRAHQRRRGAADHLRPRAAERAVLAGLDGRPQPARRRPGHRTGAPPRRGGMPVRGAGGGNRRPRRR